MKRQRWMTLCLAGFALSSGGLLLADDQVPLQVFKSLDANADGKLESSEIPESQRRFLDRLMRIGDKNADGVLSQDEYTTATTDQPAEPAQDNPEGNRRRFGGPGAAGDRPDFGQMFDRIDANKDGQIARDELPEFIRDRMARVFETLGKDTLSREEYERAMARFGPPGGGFTPPGGAGGPSTAQLRSLDRNGDGKLEREELPEFMRDRMGRLFDQVGTDMVDIEQVEQLLAQRGRPEGRPEGAPGDRFPAPRDGESFPQRRGFPGGGGFGMPGEGFRGPAFLRALDTNGDMQLSAEEIERAAANLKKLDRNGDNSLNTMELMGDAPGFPGSGGPPPLGAPPFARRDGDGPPRDDDRRDADRPRDGERDDDARRDGERDDDDRPEGERRDRERDDDDDRRDADRPRDGERDDDARRDGERRDGERDDDDRPEGERRDGDRPREGERRDGERPRPEGAPRDGARPPFPGGGPGPGMPLFRELDVDRNGRLSRDELREAIGKLDRNGDGELDAGEVMGFGGPRGGEGGPRPGFGPGPAPGPEGEGRGRFGGPAGFSPDEMFSRMDRDGNGSISREELPERLRERFAELDRNDDDQLSPEEVRAGLRGIFGGGAGGGPRPGNREGDRPDGEDRPQRPALEGEKPPRA